MNLTNLVDQENERLCDKIGGMSDEKQQAFASFVASCSSTEDASELRQKLMVANDWRIKMIVVLAENAFRNILRIAIEKDCWIEEG